LHSFSCLALFSIFLYERFNNLSALLFEALCLGCVSSCKYTSGGIVVMACIRQFNLTDIIGFGREFFASSFRSFVLVVLVIVIHFFCYAVHLQVLPYRAEEDWGSPPSVLEALVERMAPDWGRRYGGHSVLYRIFALMLSMHKTNMQVPHNHPYGSRWYTWPLCTGKWVLFWGQDGRHIAAVGNILLWWPVFFGIVLGAVMCLLRWDIGSERAVLIYGYLASLIPFMFITRDCFLYHYAVPLIIGCCHLGLFLERELPAIGRGFAFCLFGSMAVFGYFFWCPWAYGLMTPDFDFMTWNRKWSHS
jgi:dolichyl-phosphate-mannose-protein mannosyltransferase